MFFELNLYIFEGKVMDIFVHHSNYEC